jgi:hypothetical protein
MSDERQQIQNRTRAVLENASDAWLRNNEPRFGLSTAAESDLGCTDLPGESKWLESKSWCDSRPI